MITLHLLRHGETVWHAENRYAGVTDVQLTDRGRAQAQALSPWARDAAIDVVATSDLTRATLTAQVVATAAGVPLVVDSRLREVDFGRAEGLTRDEMRREFPHDLEAFLAKPASTPLPQGEMGSLAVNRGWASVADAVRGVGDGATIAVVAHTTLIRLMLCAAMGIPLDDYRRRFPRLENTALTTLTLPRVFDPLEPIAAASLLRYNAPAVVV
ncbi:histidine phosphatase family protein [Microbacterium sp. ET2]|uniref:histidine phosphatase family protein n=1 Tax=Microbacterium albipurpureum TaxID=3050384 RepID=UPI00259CDA04|nr:histidine phosphatase family protein [Microbacterium sp. ET2 (Ac-2212)]WJL96989.1 histidine phosphatase family protein [Microbacterium sp. ET2 (Ac-2212)]